MKHLVRRFRMRLSFWVWPYPNRMSPLDYAFMETTLGVDWTTSYIAKYNRQTEEWISGSA